MSFRRLVAALLVGFTALFATACASVPNGDEDDDSRASEERERPRSGMY